MNTRFDNEKLFRALCKAGALAGLAITFALMAVIVRESVPAWRAAGLSLIFSQDWNPAGGSYGAAGALAGTVLTAALALALAVPLAFAAALFVNSAPPKISAPLAHALDLLAAIPSVIYGMWGLFILCPLLQGAFARLGFESTGFGLVPSALVLALMILPYISAVMRDVLAQTPASLVESAAGVGCTRWEATWQIVVRARKAGLCGAVMIGLGRALGETMAVLFVCGGVSKIPGSLLDGCTTIAATLANDFAEADGIHKSALFALGGILLAFEFAIQAAVAPLLKERKGK
ncbi:MAG: phosphate ABC transporter permease subunit PstC [Kiritimatiellae bacterium]|nr:phosphate ABC transporter permease subunit PstC [Kiritimatiellia bacterium]